jgi:hypothetical protein
VLVHDVPAQFFFDESCVAGTAPSERARPLLEAHVGVRERRASNQGPVRYIHLTSMQWM